MKHILILIALMLGGCHESSSSSGGGSAPAPAVSYKCAIGFYNFGTDSDGKTHFTFLLQDKGRVKYNLQDGPVGKYELIGDKVSMNNVFPNDPVRRLELYVTEAAEDCRYITLQGTVNGAAVTSKRI